VPILSFSRATFSRRTTIGISRSAGSFIASWISPIMHTCECPTTHVKVSSKLMEQVAPFLKTARPKYPNGPRRARVRYSREERSRASPSFPAAGCRGRLWSYRCLESGA
jgi:hypothetical protein